MPTVLSPGRILVVDDDRLVLATVVQGLTDAGYEVIDADNGDDAILLAREHRPQLALLDIRMNGKSGFDVAATLRDPKYGIPFMFLSAFSDEATQRQVQALGALDYLVKPLEVAQIVPRVEAAFARLAAEAAAGAGQSAPPTSTTRAAPGLTPAAAQPEPVAGTAGLGEDPVPLAVGVLMHRHSLTRQAAFSRLQTLAGSQSLSLAAQAERLLAAVEELARTAT